MAANTKTSPRSETPSVGSKGARLQAAAARASASSSGPATTPDAAGAARRTAKEVA